MTSARIPGGRRSSSRAQVVCFLTRSKGTPGLTHRGCVLQRVFLDAHSDVTFVLGMRQSMLKDKGIA